MITSLKKAFAAYSRHPFLFIWSSFIYVALLVLFLFASIGLYLIYFLLASVLSINPGLSEAPTLAILAVIGLLLIFFLGGLNAGLMKSYADALESKKTTIAEFFRYSILKAPNMFAIMLLRDFLFLLIAGPILAIYWFVLIDIEFMDALTGLAVLLIMFLIHWFFTPSMIYCGVFGTDLFQSLRSGFHALRSKHVYILGLYIVFALLWIFNFIPIVSLITIFALYPIAYAAIIYMLHNRVR